MSTLFSFRNGDLILANEVRSDSYVNRLIASEFEGIKSISSPQTKQIINELGFDWDMMSVPGYLTFRPYAAFMEETTKLFVWKNVQRYCSENQIPVQRIAGGDLYSLNNPLMKQHKTLAEEVGMYGDGLLEVTGNQILRFSGCTNKLSLLKQTNIDDRKLPFGIFEISHSYRYETEDELDCLVRNRFFHLPELHIINENLDDGLNALLSAHSFMLKTLEKYGLDHIMLFSTTRAFVDTHLDFIKEMCVNAKHPPVINIADEDSCENGIVFDVEYKACMSNDNLVEIGTFQIDEGSTGFAYGICYRGRPVTTVHAVFFGSSIERTIYTFCDLSIRDNVPLPRWLAPVHIRILPELEKDIELALRYAAELSETYRVEVDDRSISIEEKMKDASKLMIEKIICIGADNKPNDITEQCYSKIGGTNANLYSKEDFGAFNQFYPIRLSQRIL